MINNLPFIMLYCLACTVVLECVTAFLLGRRQIKALLTVALVNVITNPIVVSVSFFIRISMGRDKYFVSLIILEIIAVFAEGLIYRFALKGKLNPFLFSLILNALSFFIGEIINKIVF